MLFLYMEYLREIIVDRDQSITRLVRRARVEFARRDEPIPEMIILSNEEEHRAFEELSTRNDWGLTWYEVHRSGRIAGIPYRAVSEEEYQWERIRPASHRSPFLPSMGRRLEYNPRGYRFVDAEAYRRMYIDGTFPTETTGVYGVYARHGGHKRSTENTKAMKLNPLCKLDEQLRKLGEEE